MTEREDLDHLAPAAVADRSRGLRTKLHAAGGFIDGMDSK